MNFCCFPRPPKTNIVFLLLRVLETEYKSNRKLLEIKIQEKSSLGVIK